MAAEEHKLHGHTAHQGMPIAVENRKGSVRSGVDRDGKPWRTVMKAQYGYLKGTRGADGEEIDCYVGPHKDAPNVHVVHQKKHDGTGFDEHKIMLGFSSESAARRTYLQHHNNNTKLLGPIKTVPVEEFKQLLSKGGTLKKLAAATLEGLISELEAIVRAS